MWIFHFSLDLCCCGGAFLAQVNEEKCTVFGPGTDFRGRVQFSTTLIIQGYYEGRVQAEGELIVDIKATVKADIVTKSVLLSGNVVGNIKVTHLLELLSTANLIGDVNVGSFHVEKGAVFKGRISMLKDPDALDIFSASPDQLKRLVRE